MTEQEILEQFFSKSHNPPHEGVILGIGDDAAILKVPQGEVLVATTDTLVEHIHFLAEADPLCLGYKSVAVNLSDLAAMGARPAWMLCNLILPQADPLWLKLFSQGMFEALHQFGVSLVGGNLARGPLAISFTALGLLPKGTGVLRQGAKAGDYIAVTGCIGLAALAFLHQQKKEVYPVSKEAFLRLHRPEPRVDVGIALRSIASSMIDVTDGLVKDCTRLLCASGLGASIILEQIPFPCERAELEDLALLESLISFGDDYELCFTLPSHYVQEKEGQLESPVLKEIGARTGVPIHLIGLTHSEGRIDWQYQGEGLNLGDLGYDHFQNVYSAPKIKKFSP